MEDPQQPQDGKQEQGDAPQEVTCSGGLKLNLGAALARYPHLQQQLPEPEGGDGGQ